MLSLFARLVNIAVVVSIVNSIGYYLIMNIAPADAPKMNWDLV